MEPPQGSLQSFQGHEIVMEPATNWNPPLLDHKLNDVGVISLPKKRCCKKKSLLFFSGFACQTTSPGSDLDSHCQITDKAFKIKRLPRPGCVRIAPSTASSVASERPGTHCPTLNIEQEYTQHKLVKQSIL